MHLNSNDRAYIRSKPRQAYSEGEGRNSEASEGVATT